jgi:hypothetical protein
MLRQSCSSKCKCAAGFGALLLPNRLPLKVAQHLHHMMCKTDAHRDFGSLPFLYCSVVDHEI